jgi:hypothetical protein|nr:MAG TPA: Protein of unknown function (DUF2577) [Caudoviricetes sp.]
MNGYERIIKMMREQGAVNNPASLQLGEMTSAKTCKIGDLKLDADDLLIAEHLTEYEKKIDIEDKSVTSTNTKIKIHGKLKKGDLVLVYRLSDEQYVIIEKLVEVV